MIVGALKASTKTVTEEGPRSESGRQNICMSREVVHSGVCN